ncbi:hypothetical protein RS130_23190 [Paraglaciecola aquimarina]|uniref:MotA/TolQ/ExbB proton channel domain-containing protein n=1 Tax=Paraglaciecola aquimarina TaxID=1235557 RepID=A0ABU3T2I0_9ALTE|nr:hypothetical protein [Paraglaciecola aquimarina]MDU0356412.1 hypothetical protein [Paraglaciecola aquimarina]
MFAIKAIPSTANLIGLFLGTGIILLAVASYLTQMPVIDLVTWLQSVFSWGFVIIFSALFSIGVVAGASIQASKNNTFLYDVGIQAANGISTLALTFTLLGISLGIGSLSEQPLSPSSVNGIIGELTEQFSMAFMTTVVGLPSSAIIRAWVSLRYSKIETE